VPPPLRDDEAAAPRGKILATQEQQIEVKAMKTAARKKSIPPTVRASSRGPLALVGEGQLHDALAARLAREWNVVVTTDETVRGKPSMESGPMMVVATDTTDQLEVLWTRALRHGTAWLPVYAELDRVVIGPGVRPGEAGCVRCFDRRRSSASADPKARADLQTKHGLEISRSRSPLLVPLTAVMASSVAAEEVASWAAGIAGRTRQAAIMLNLATLAVSVHRFLPDPFCPLCGGLPEDSPEGARIVPRSRPKVSPRSVRTRDLIALEPKLLASYVDDETGLVTATRPSGEFPLPVVSARLHASDSESGEEGWGRTLDFRGARLTAIAEALERMGGLRPGGRRTVVRGSYHQLQDRALDPKTLGLYPEERYALKDFPYQRYHDDLEFSWVWGYSFARGAPVLVPERYAYYGLKRSKHAGAQAVDWPFIYEISNGCALGSCLEEAVVHGLLEVAERDAFLMTWFAQMPVPRLDPTSARDPRIALLLERVKHRLGYEVLIFNTTVEQGIPCFWVMAVDEARDPDRPRALCAAGSALEPERAVINALQELTTLLEIHVRNYAGGRERAEAMVKDPYLVQKMEDHSLLYSHPDAFDRFGFLLSSGPARPFADFEEMWRWPQHDDLRGDLDEIIGRYRGAGLDVVVVDQTTPEHHACGFACVKAIVPGTLPMAFGHHLRRVDGLPRLLKVPQRLGYRQSPLSVADLYQHPHPFP
jgi:ribosomal protein S12 methylthiotransferase accessory factor